MMNARHEDRLREAAREVPGAATVAADVSTPQGRTTLLEAAREVGPVGAVVLNAGQGWSGLVEEMPAEDVHRLVDLNLTGVIELSRLVLPEMLERGEGDLVVTSSIAAWSQVPPLTVYSATKAGVQGYVRGLRREVSARGVHVHTVNPGPVRTEWLARGAGHVPVDDADGRGRLSPGIPPEWVAAAVERCLRAPGPRTRSVPRVMGLARLGEVPPVNRVLDQLLSSNAARVSEVAQRSRERSEGPTPR